MTAFCRVKMKKYLHTVAMCSSMLISGHAWAERYAMIPTLKFVHEAAECQYYAEQGSKTKKNTIAFRVFETCNGVQTTDYGSFGKEIYVSKVVWYEGRCTTREVAWRSTLRFNRQFWDGSREESKTNSSNDFGKIHFVYAPAFEYVCNQHFSIEKSS